MRRTLSHSPLSEDSSKRAFWKGIVPSSFHQHVEEQMIRFIMASGKPMSEHPRGLLQMMARLSMTRFIAIERNQEIEIALYPYAWGGMIENHKLHWEALKKRLPEVTFIGAGYYYPDDRGVEFDSSTLKELFGYDRPVDVGLQKGILEGIKAFARR